MNIIYEEDEVVCPDILKWAGEEPEKVLRLATCDDEATEKADRAESRWSFRERSPREDAGCSQGYESLPGT